MVWPGASSISQLAGAGDDHAFDIVSTILP